MVRKDALSRRYIRMYLIAKRCETVELCFIAQEGDEFDRQNLIVNILVEIEQEYLQDRGDLAYRWIDARIGRPPEASAVFKMNHSGIDAKFWMQEPSQAQIGCRKSDGSAELPTMLDDSCNHGV